MLTCAECMGCGLEWVVLNLAVLFSKYSVNFASHDQRSTEIVIKCIEGQSTKYHSWSVQISFSIYISKGEGGYHTFSWYLSQGYFNVAYLYETDDKIYQILRDLVFSLKWLYAQ